MWAYDTAKPGSLITIMCDVVAEALDLIKGLKEKKMRKMLHYKNVAMMIQLMSPTPGKELGFFLVRQSQLYPVSRTSAFNTSFSNI